MPAPGKTPEQVEAALRAEVARVARDGVSEAELNRVKTQWIAGEVYKLDSVMNQARELGSYWIQGLPLDAGERLIQRLRGVTAEQVKAVAAKLLRRRPAHRGRAAAASRVDPESQAAHARRRACATEQGLLMSHDNQNFARCCGCCLRCLPAPRRRWPRSRSSTGRSPAAPRSTWSRALRIPMVDVQIDFDAGGRREPADKAGLASVTAGMTSKGIEAARTAQPGAWTRTSSAKPGPTWAPASVASAGSDRMSFSLRSLTYPDLLPKAVQLAARQLGEPAFPEDVWQRERQRMAASIREANTRPATLAGTRLRGRPCTAAIPMAMTRPRRPWQRIGVQDMRQMYRLVEPCRAKVSIVGAVTRAQADAMVDARCCRACLPRHGRCEPLPPVAEVPPLAAAAGRARSRSLRPRRMC